MCFAHCVAVDGFDAIPMMEATSCSVKLFRELFQVVSRIFTKTLRFVFIMLRVRSLVLTHVTI